MSLYAIDSYDRRNDHSWYKTAAGDGKVQCNTISSGCSKRGMIVIALELSGAIIFV